MSIIVNGVTLPDIPEDVLADYPYALIMSVISSGTYTASMLFVSKTPMIAWVEHPIYGSIVDAVLMATDSPAVMGYFYDPIGEAEWFAQSDSESSESMVFYVGTVSSDAFTLDWANHDIMKAVTAEDGTNFTVTEEVYFVNRNISYNDIYFVTSKWLQGMASEIRRLTGTTGTKTTDAMKTGLSELPNVSSIVQNCSLMSNIKGDDYTVTVSFKAETINNLSLPSCLIPTIKRAEFPNVSRIYSADFDLLINLQEVTFNSATDMALSQFTRHPTLTKFVALKIPKIESYTFENCTTLKEIYLAEATTTGQRTFSGCTGLTEIKQDFFPELTTIEYAAFRGCTNLVKADFPKLTKLNSVEIFNDCTSLTALIIRNPDSVCSCMNLANVFANTPIAAGTGYIYVPSAIVDNYKAHSRWSVYANQFRAIEDYSDICGE